AQDAERQLGRCRYGVVEQIDRDVTALSRDQHGPPETGPHEERTTDLVRPGDLHPLIEQEADEDLRQDHDQHGAEQENADTVFEPMQDCGPGLRAGRHGERDGHVRGRARFGATNWPQPGRPSSVPSRMTTRPLTIVQTGRPFVANPSNGVILLFDWKRSDRTVPSRSRSTITRSASDPTARTPFRG